jgi:photosystem II stability/assembly factor-like uncharacterized protein
MSELRVLFLVLVFSSPADAQWWKVQTSGLDTNLRGVSAAYTPDEQDVPVPVVWVSGSKGIILRSLDLGKAWKRLHVTGGDALDFRGIVAFDASTAFAMSSGEGDKSRIYKTTDGGVTWKLQYTDSRKEFFLDSVACISEKECVALGDPVDGKFLLLKTSDGEHWDTLPATNIPAALPSEGAFAASNSCIALSGDEIFFVTGGPAARVFHSADSGRTWTAAETPIAHGNASSGIFSIARPQGDAASTVVIVGGDYQDPIRASAIAATSVDGGKTWKLSLQQPGGFRSGVAALDSLTFFAVGPSGEEMSVDQGAHWKHTDSLNLNTIVILDDHHGWAVGPNGTIAVLVNHLPYEIRHRHPHDQPPSRALAVAE